MPPGFPNLPSCHIACLKWCSGYKKTKCMVWFHAAKSVIMIYRIFAIFGQEPPSKESLCKWNNLFVES
jgi:hypothetical protein